MSRIKKISALLLFFALLGNTAIFAQENEQKFSDQELMEFSTAFEKLQAVNAEAQQKMVEVVKSEGMDMKRFNEIHVAYINPNIKGDATPEELKKHDRIMRKVKKMQETLQDNMDEVVKSSGLSTRKYQKIASEMRTDKTLQARYKKMATAEEE